MNGRPAYFGIWVVLLLGLAACAPRSVEAQKPSIVEQAAQEATRIVQEAQATALVLQAQARATQIAGKAQSMLETPVSATLVVQVQAGEQKAPIAASTMENKAEPDETIPAQQVEIVRVGFAGEGGFIVIQFRAPKEIAEKWWQGSIPVIDEDTQAVYNEIPEMPKIGP